MPVPARADACVDVLSSLTLHHNYPAAPVALGIFTPAGERRGRWGWVRFFPRFFGLLGSGTAGSWTAATRYQFGPWGLAVRRRLFHAPAVGVRRDDPQTPADLRPL